jgi:hypothetical protein
VHNFFDVCRRLDRVPERVDHVGARLDEVTLRVEKVPPRGDEVALPVERVALRVADGDRRLDGLAPRWISFLRAWPRSLFVRTTLLLAGSGCSSAGTRDCSADRVAPGPATIGRRVDRRPPRADEPALSADRVGSAPDRGARAVDHLPFLGIGRLVGWPASLRGWIGRLVRWPASAENGSAISRPDREGRAVEWGNGILDGIAHEMEKASATLPVHHNPSS